MQKSRFAWSFFLALLLLAGLLVVNFPQVSQAVSDNMSALTFLRDWGRESRDISQVICERNSQPLAPAVQQDQSAVINAAREAYFLGNCERALANWTLAAENDPQQETAALMRYLSSGLNPELLPANMSAEETAEFLKGLGLWAEQEKRADQAAYWFTQSFAIQPSRFVADRLIRSLQQDDEKLAVWQRLADMLPQEDADHWWAFGQQAELSQAWDQAANAYEAGAQIADDPFAFLMEQGIMLTKLDRLDEAESMVQKALSLRPQNSQPYVQLGHIARLQGDIQSAKDWYEQAVQIAPDKFTQNYRLGLAYYDLGQFDLAEQYLSTAVDISPKNSSALYYLAQSAYQNGRQTEAEAFLEDAVLADGGSHWNWLVILGDWRAASGDGKRALQAYNQALDLRPNEPELIDKIQKIEDP